MSTTARTGRTRTRPGIRARAALAAAVVAGLGCATLSALPAAAADASVKVQYRQSSSGSDQAEPWFKVVNSGSTTLSLSEVRIRYYFKADAGASYTFACSWAVRGCANITGTFGTLAAPTADADRYLEIGFRAGAGSLAPGADTGDMQLRFHRSDWRPLNQSDDYSFGPGRTSYGDWTKVTASVGGGGRERAERTGDVRAAPYRP
jgi:hypothetical protein